MATKKAEKPSAEGTEETAAEEKPRLNGTVKWFDTRKGYGFITGEDGNDYFVHHTSLPEGTVLKEEDKVSFEPGETEKGRQAINVQKQA